MFRVNNKNTRTTSLFLCPLKTSENLWFFQIQHKSRGNLNRKAKKIKTTKIAPALPTICNNVTTLAQLKFFSLVNINKTNHSLYLKNNCNENFSSMLLYFHYDLFTSIYFTDNVFIKVITTSY